MGPSASSTEAPPPFPNIEPYERGLLDVGDAKRVHWETSGNPDGKPALVVHGGPGSGGQHGSRKLFDPNLYRIVIFDQRGCGECLPHASDPAAGMAHNTTDHLIADMERLRKHLGVTDQIIGMVEAEFLAKIADGAIVAPHAGAASTMRTAAA